jgi:hypothetical protein
VARKSRLVIRIATRFHARSSPRRRDEERWETLLRGGGGGVE